MNADSFQICLSSAAFMDEAATVVEALSRSSPSSSGPAGATWSPTSFIVDDGLDPDGLNLGSVVVDEEKALIILIYSFRFHISACASTMMIESKTDGLSWSVPRNISGQIGVQPFAPGPGFGIQVSRDSRDVCV